MTPNVILREPERSDWPRRVILSEAKDRYPSRQFNSLGLKAIPYGAKRHQGMLSSLRASG